MNKNDQEKRQNQIDQNQIDQKQLKNKTLQNQEESCKEIIDQKSYGQDIPRDTPQSDLVDKVVTDKIFKLRETPPEMVVQGQIDHRSLNEPLDISVTVDSGAGFTYLLIPRTCKIDYITTRLEETLEVSLPNSVTLRVNKVAYIAITLFAIDQNYKFTQKRVPVYIIPKETSGLELLLGRDQIDAFGITIIGASRIQINQIDLYDSHASPLTTPKAPTARDKIQQIREITPHLRGIPSYLLDIVEDHDTVTYGTEDFEDDILNSLCTGKDPVVYLGPPDPRAPLGRFCIKIPWRSAERPKRGFSQVWARDNLTIKRLNSGDLGLYRSAIQTLIDSKFAVPTKENSDMHYIACRPVIKTSRTSTKCRVCLDAREINRYTYPGLTFCQPIIVCLLMFRSARHLVMYDLCQAFWQLRYHPQDIGWFCTILDGQPLCFERMIFGSNFSPSGLEVALKLLRTKAHEHLKDAVKDGEPQRPADLEGIFSYVDDFVHISDNPSTVLTQSTWYQWWLLNHGFPSAKVIDNMERGGHTTYLGYNYDATKDTIAIIKPHIDMSIIPQEPQIHQVVAIIGRLYDPLGLELRLQLLGRSIVRAAFACKIGTQNVHNMWLMHAPSVRPLLEEFVQRVSLLGSHSFPRFCAHSTLHVFTDASSAAWAFEVRDENYVLVFAKGGLVCPTHTIPRNELLAIHAAVTHLQTLVVQLKVQQIVIFTDSLCNLQRIDRENAMDKLPTFENRRIETIRKHIAEWSIQGILVQMIHIPGEINPADFPTRPHETRSRPPIDKDLITQYKRTPWVPRATRLMLLRPNQGEPTNENLEQNEHEDIPYDPDIAKIIEQSQKTFPITMNEYYTYDQHDYIRRDDRLVIPEQDVALKTLLIARHHDRAHRGITATLAAISKQYYWTGMRRDVKRFVNDCTTCQLARHTRTIRTTAGDTLTINDIESIPLGSIVGVDIAVIDGCGEEDATCIITTTCLISKFIRSLPMRTQLSEEIVETLKKLFIGWIFPKVLVMDNAVQFKSKTMKKFAIRYGIRLCYLPPHASPYGGWVERSHQTILTALRTLTTVHPNTPWPTLVEEACWLANTRPYDDDTDLCPLNMMFTSSQPANPDDSPQESDQLLVKAQMIHLSRLTDSSNTQMEAYLSRTKQKRLGQLKAYEYQFNKRREEIRRRLKKSKRDLSDSFQPGTLVRVYRPVASKIKSKWSEPRRVISAPSGATRIIEKPDGSQSLEWIANLLATSDPPPGSVLNTETEENSEDLERT